MEVISVSDLKVIFKEKRKLNDRHYFDLRIKDTMECPIYRQTSYNCYFCLSGYCDTTLENRQPSNFKEILN